MRDNLATYIGVWQTDNGKLPTIKDILSQPIFPEKTIKEPFFYLYFSKSMHPVSTVHFNGKCEDCYGESDIKGNQYYWDMVFEKKYENSQILKGASSSTLEYLGKEHSFNIKNFPKNKNEIRIVSGIITNPADPSDYSLKEQSLPKLFWMVDMEDLVRITNPVGYKRLYCK